MTHLVLTRPHTHAGKAYGVGERVEIDATSADWLIAHGIATREPDDTIAESIPKSKPTKSKKTKQC